MQFAILSVPGGEFDPVPFWSVLISTYLLMSGTHSGCPVSQTRPVTPRPLTGLWSKKPSMSLPGAGPCRQG
jgi:hypothetical protein